MATDTKIRVAGEETDEQTTVDAVHEGVDTDPSDTDGPDSVDVNGDSPDEADDVRDGADTERPRALPTRPAALLGLVAVAALAVLVGWLGVQAYHSQQTLSRHELYLQVARQGAINLTTIDWQSADADVQRILSSATGTFYDDFSARSGPFVDVVTQAQASSVGTVVEAGIESATETGAQVLVAVSVETTNAGSADPQPRAWRMRITVDRTGDDAKVSNVEFVP